MILIRHPISSSYYTKCVVIPSCISSSMSLISISGPVVCIVIFLIENKQIRLRLLLNDNVVFIIILRRSYIMLSYCCTIFKNLISNKLNISGHVSPQINERIKRSRHMESVNLFLGCMTTWPLFIEVSLTSQNSASSNLCSSPTGFELTLLIHCSTITLAL